MGVRNDEVDHALGVRLRQRELTRVVRGLNLIYVAPECENQPGRQAVESIGPTTASTRNAAGLHSIDRNPGPGISHRANTRTVAPATGRCRRSQRACRPILPGRGQDPASYTPPSLRAALSAREQRERLRIRRGGGDCHLLRRATLRDSVYVELKSPVTVPSVLRQNVRCRRRSVSEHSRRSRRPEEPVDAPAGTSDDRRSAAGHGDDRFSAPGFHRG